MEDQRLRLVPFAATAHPTGSPRPVAAWGDEGHEIVAFIAYARLAPAVRARVDAQLSADTDPLTAPDVARRATWADRYRDADRNGAQVGFPGFPDTSNDMMCSR